MAGPWVMPAMMAATEAGGAGMAAAASAAAAEAAAAALASGVATSALPGIASSAAGSAVPGAALPAMQAAGTQGLAGAMGNMAPVVDAMAGQSGPVIAGMNQGANLLTTPVAKAIDSMGPIGKALGNASKGWQIGQKLMGQNQAQTRQPMAPAAPPPIQPSGGGMQKLPNPAQIAAYNRVKQRRQMQEMLAQRGGMMS